MSREQIAKLGNLILLTRGVYKIMNLALLSFTIIRINCKHVFSSPDFQINKLPIAEDPQRRNVVHGNFRENASIVSLDFRFEMNSGLINQCFQPIFAQVSEELITTFQTRADEVYAT